MKSKMTNRNKTFWIIAILVIALFFTFNTLPMIKGVIYSFTNYKGTVSRIGPSGAAPAACRRYPAWGGPPSAPDGNTGARCV